MTPHSPNAERINASYKWISLFTVVDLRASSRRRSLFVRRPLPAARRGRARPRAPQIHGAHAARADLDGHPGADPGRDRGLHLLRAPGHPGRARRRRPRADRLRSRVERAPVLLGIHVPERRPLDRRDARAARADVVRVDDHLAATSRTAGGSRARREVRRHPRARRTTPGSRRTSSARSSAQCGELCGVLHAKMEADVHGRRRTAEYETLGSAQARRSRDSAAASWTGVCAKCHGPQGAGRLRPGDREQRAARRSRRACASLLNGQNRPPIGNYMPPVGARLDRPAVRRARRLPEDEHLQGSGEWRLEPRPYRADWRRGPVTSLDHDRRPQADRDPLHRHVARLLRRRRDPRAADARAARARRTSSFITQELLQRAVHDPRDDDDLPVHRPVLGRARRTSSCR